MKKNIILKIVATIIMVIIVFCGNIVYASDGLPDLNDTGYQPKVELPTGGNAMNIVSTILGVLKVVGIIAIVVSVAMIGFNTILGSASEKALGQEKFVGILIAAVLITFGSMIAQFIIEAAEKAI